MRILIVEDAPTLADGLTRSLKRADYAVDCVHDGEQADQVLAAQSYDLVILDLGLPKLDGFEVIRRVRRRGATVPVLVLTAHDALADRVKGLDLGARVGRAGSADAAKRPRRQQGTTRGTTLRPGRRGRQQRNRSLCPPI